MKPELISRRKVLKYGGLLTATAAGQEFLSSWLPNGNSALAADGMHHGNRGGQGAPEASTPDASASYTPRFFKPDEFQTVEILTEMIIPTDDKPGAKEARVAQFIDFVVDASAEYQPELQQKWIEGLALLDKLSTSKYARSFREASVSDREQLLTEVSRPEHDRSAEHPGFEFYRLVKEITVEAFYTSRVGLIDVLEYKGLSVNADFPGCTHPEHQEGVL
jgi:hypothetical protein